jgi:hypothetical protein
MEISEATMLVIASAIGLALTTAIGKLWFSTEKSHEYVKLALTTCEKREGVLEAKVDSLEKKIVGLQETIMESLRLKAQDNAGAIAENRARIDASDARQDAGDVRSEAMSKRVDDSQKQ